MSLHIELPLVFDCKLSNIHFNDFETSKKRFDFRRKNLKITQMMWLTTSPVIDYGNTLYNPKCLIMIILN